MRNTVGFKKDLIFSMEGLLLFLSRRFVVVVAAAVARESVDVVDGGSGNKQTSSNPCSSLLPLSSPSHLPLSSLFILALLCVVGVDFIKSS